MERESQNGNVTGPMPESGPSAWTSEGARAQACPVGGRPGSVLPDEDDLTRLVALLREQTKVDFTFYKRTTLTRCIQRRMAVHQVSDLGAYVRLLESRSEEPAALCRAMFIGVTRFFRDPDVFEELGEKVLPKFLEGGDGREIRFWVAGCSTGEEAYTLAILALECLERLGRPRHVRIFATDLDGDAIRRAGIGQYPESIAADLPPDCLHKYFVRRGDHYQVQRFVRERMIFARHNLITDPPFSRIDLLSCRNLLIYLQPAWQQRIMDSIHFSLTPQGVLLLGPSEMPGNMGDRFEPLNHRFKIYRSRGTKRPTLDGLWFPVPLQDVPHPVREPVTSQVHVDEISMETEPHVRDLAQELQFMKERLEATLEELETSNEALRAAHEALRSVNGELHRRNVEYQNAIMELTERTNDLENLMTATRIGTVLLDENLEIRRVTPEVTRWLRIHPHDVGRPVSHLSHLLAGVDLPALLRRVKEENRAREEEGQTGDGMRLLVRALPYRIGAAAASGIVLTFTDLGRLKRTNDDKRASLVGFAGKQS